MSEIRQQSIQSPTLTSLFKGPYMSNLLSNINCVNIGKISSVDIDSQTVEVDLQVLRRTEGGTVPYSILVDCPLFVYQGGGAFLEFPVAEGDYCIVLFNDRDFSTWWDSENVKEPLSNRKHSLSDAIVLTGINSNVSTLDLAGDRVKLFTNDNDLDIETGSGAVNVTTENGEVNVETGGGSVTVDSGGGDVDLISNGGAVTVNAGAGTVDIESNTVCNINCTAVNIGGDSSLTEFLVKGTSYLTLFTTFFSALSGASGGAPPDNAAAISTIAGAAGAAMGSLTNTVSTNVRTS